MSKRWIIGCVTVLSIAAAGAGWAAIPSGNVITGCVLPSSGLLRVIPG